MTSKPWIDRLVRLAEAGATFHITDTETSGSSPRGARVIELATVSIRHGEVVDRFETLIDPGIVIPSWITRINGINNRMLRGAPPPDQAIAHWLAYVGRDHHFVAHNAPFDHGFLAMECERANLAWPFAGVHCTVRLARHCLPGLQSRSLGALIEHYQLAVPARHRALADAEATATIFLRLLDTLQAAAPTAAESGPAFTS